MKSARRVAFESERAENEYDFIVISVAEVQINRSMYEFLTAKWELEFLTAKWELRAMENISNFIKK